MTILTPLLLFLLAWATMAMMPNTPLGRSLRRWLVDRPSAMLGRVRRGQVLLAILSLAVICAVVALLREDGAMLVNLAAPEALALASAIDLASLLDAALVAVVALSATRLHDIGGRVRRSVRRAARARP